jgi:glycerol-3-phosphate dehydrogenase
VFVLPRADGLALVGLTDEPHDGPPSDAPEVTAAEEDGLLAGLAAALERPLDRADVVGRYAGLRPLIAGSAARTEDLSRHHALVEDSQTGVIAIVGGKLTTYRRMAQDTVDRIAARPGVSARPCRTENLPLVGAGPPPTGAPELLVRRYGAEAPQLVALAERDPELLRPIAPGVPVLGAELLWAANAEGALTVADVVERRTRAGLVPERAAAVRAAVERLTPELAPAAEHDPNTTLAR